MLLIQVLGVVWGVFFSFWGEMGRPAFGTSPRRCRAAPSFPAGGQNAYHTVRETAIRMEIAGIATVSDGSRKQWYAILPALDNGPSLNLQSPPVPIGVLRAFSPWLLFGRVLGKLEAWVSPCLTDKMYSVVLAQKSSPDCVDPCNSNQQTLNGTL